jgi:hypothetical protein
MKIEFNEKELAEIFNVVYYDYVVELETSKIQKKILKKLKKLNLKLINKKYEKAKNIVEVAQGKDWGKIE